MFKSFIYFFGLCSLIYASNKNDSDKKFSANPLEMFTPPPGYSQVEDYHPENLPPPAPLWPSDASQDASNAANTAQSASTLSKVQDTPKVSNSQSASNAENGSQPAQFSVLNVPPQYTMNSQANGLQGASNAPNVVQPIPIPSQYIVNGQLFNVLQSVPFSLVNVPLQYTMNSQANVPQQYTLNSQVSVPQQCMVNSQANVPPQYTMNSQVSVPEQCMVNSQAHVPSQYTMNSQANGLQCASNAPNAVQPTPIPSQYTMNSQANVPSQYTMNSQANVPSQYTMNSQANGSQSASNAPNVRQPVPFSVLNVPLQRKCPPYALRNVNPEPKAIKVLSYFEGRKMKVTPSRIFVKSTKESSFTFSPEFSEHKVSKRRIYLFDTFATHVYIGLDGTITCFIPANAVLENMDELSEEETLPGLDPKKIFTDHLEENYENYENLANYLVSTRYATGFGGWNDILETEIRNPHNDIYELAYKNETQPLDSEEESKHKNFSINIALEYEDNHRRPNEHNTEVQMAAFWRLLPLLTQKGIKKVTMDMELPVKDKPSFKRPRIGKPS